MILFVADACINSCSLTFQPQLKNNIKCKQNNNQGSRLTAYEIMVENAIPWNPPSSYLANKANPQNTVCVVGADRVCANSDTANKICTFQLVIIAKEFNVDFSWPRQLASGKEIEIEEQPAGELLESSVHRKI